MRLKHKTTRRTNKLKVNIWDMPETSAAIDLAYEGYGYKLIARILPLTTWQAAYRIRKHGVSVTDVRNGMTDESKAKIADILRKHGLVKTRKAG